ncbi:MAG: hypothetical protein FWD71_22560, partial [Oscillospiraceae bacterium]|nr:hypothetical protein [Oscillospiraceae bacterium]
MNNRWVEEILADKDTALIGFADLSEIDINLRRGFKYGICIAMAGKVRPSTTSEPSGEYYNKYRKISKKLNETSRYLTDKIKERGFNAVPA